MSNCLNQYQTQQYAMLFLVQTVCKSYQQINTNSIDSWRQNDVLQITSTISS